MPSDFHYYPLNPGWDSDKKWLSEIRRAPRQVRAALRGWRKVLTPTNLYKQSWHRNGLALDHAFKFNRWRFLEAGWMLNELDSLGDLSIRLRKPERYPQAIAELRGGLLLSQLGFEIEYEPSNRNTTKQQKTKGPDWKATREGVTFGVEVKCPQVSKQSHALTVFPLQAYWKLLDVCDQVPSAIEIAEDAAHSCVIGDTLNESLLDELVLEAAAEFNRVGTCTTRLGAISQGSGTGGCDIRCAATSSLEHEGRKIRRLLETASGQLRGRGPGIVVIDTSVDRTAMSLCCQVSAILEESWAEPIDLVLLVADNCPGFVVTTVSRPDTSVMLLGGTPCSKGHLHVDTFGGFDCRIDTRFFNYSALCCGHGSHWSFFPPNVSTG